MNTDCQAALGNADWGAAPLAFAPPRGLVASFKQLGPVATALLKVRLLLAALKGGRRPNPGEPEEPREPEGDPRDSPWDDPALWMLIMH